MKRSVKIGLFVVGVIVLALVTMGVVKSKDRNTVEVNLGKVSRENLTSKVTANGKIDAKRKVDLSAHIMGQIVNLAVREGDRVKKGDFLLQIDRTQLAASAAGAEASLQSLFHERDAARASANEATLAHARAQKSYEDKLIPLADLERTRSAVDSARANVQAIEGRIAQARASIVGARDTLSKTTIRAPMDGIVTRLPVEEGEVAVIGTMNNPGTVLLTVADMSIVEAVMELDETDVPSVKVGQRADVRIDAYPNATFRGTVTEVGSSPQEQSLGGSTEGVHFEVKIQIENPPADVRPGFSCSADIFTGSRPNSLAIPIQAIVVREKPGAQKGAGASEEEGVFIVDAEKKVKFAPVKTGISSDTSIELVSGLQQGAEIVTGPFKALRDLKDGQKIRVAEEKKKEEKK